MAELKYRGRVVTAEDIHYIRELIAAHPRASRRRVSEKLCEAWQWRQANGALRDMVCRGLLLMLDRAGHIQLPAVKFVPHNPFVERARPEPLPVDATAILGPLAELRPVEIEQVRRTDHERLFNSLMEQHHYLAYEQPVGEHLKFLVWAKGPVWRGVRRHVTSAVGIATSAGARKRGGAISASWRITLAI